MSVCSLHPHGYPPSCSKMAAEALVITPAFQARVKGARKKGKKDLASCFPLTLFLESFFQCPTKKTPSSILVATNSCGKGGKCSLLAGCSPDTKEKGVNGH